jgi:hypothetical protein
MNKCEICGIKLTQRQLRLKCDKYYIKYGFNKIWIPFNNVSWDNYDDFKSWQYYYDRKKVSCEKCGKVMIRTSIYRHKRICL